MGGGTNPYQYTGRENDGVGLYYYRARYYSPALKRFVSEDPSGLVAGLNTYAYVHDDPLGRRDPLGLIDTDMCPANDEYWPCEFVYAELTPEPGYDKGDNVHYIIGYVKCYYRCPHYPELVATEHPAGRLTPEVVENPASVCPHTIAEP